MEPRMILVADPEKRMHQAYQVWLREYRVAHAPDGEQALERLRREKIVDLVLFDTLVSDMEAAEFVAALRDEPYPPAVVLVITPGGPEEHITRAIAAGAVATIKKPFGSDEIRALVAGLEDRPRPEDEPDPE